jgi:hypothetical protein
LAYPNARRKHPKINARWHITIVSEWGATQAESRTVTDTGIFIHCDKKLSHNKTYKIVIRPTPELSVPVKGRFVFSNLDRTEQTSVTTSTGLSFLEISVEDRQRLNDLIFMEENRMETVERITMKLSIKTDRRTLEKEFSNLFDLKIFLDNFFALHDVAERRAAQSFLRYSGHERRMRV